MDLSLARRVGACQPGAAGGGRRGGPRTTDVRLASLSAWPAGAMWRILLNALLLPIMAAVPRGIARAALTELTTLATAKTPYRAAGTTALRLASPLQRHLRDVNRSGLAAGDREAFAIPPC